MKPLAIALATIGLAGAAITPAAATEMELMTVRVATSDVNLATPDGQRVLDQRLEKAARTVCRVNSLTTGSRILSQEVRDCLAKARSDSRQQVAALTAKQQQRGV
jgi:UrcA family protein